MNAPKWNYQVMGMRRSWRIAECLALGPSISRGVGRAKLAQGIEWVAKQAHITTSNVSIKWHHGCVRQCGAEQGFLNVFVDLHP